jgi:hypothetical protein
VSFRPCAPRQQHLLLLLLLVMMMMMVLNLHYCYHQQQWQ